jgi:hypothetical protein
MSVVSSEDLAVGIKKGKHSPIELFASKKDEIEWTCKSHDFEVNIDKDRTAGSEQNATAPTNPFSKKFPLVGKKGDKIQSGPPRQDAVGQQYKYTAKAFGNAGNLVDAWDPHIIIK